MEPFRCKNPTKRSVMDEGGGSSMEGDYDRGMSRFMRAGGFRGRVFRRRFKDR